MFKPLPAVTFGLALLVSPLASLADAGCSCHQRNTVRRNCSADCSCDCATQFGTNQQPTSADVPPPIVDSPSTESDMAESSIIEEPTVVEGEATNDQVVVENPIEGEYPVVDEPVIQDNVSTEASGIQVPDAPSGSPTPASPPVDQQLPATPEAAAVEIPVAPESLSSETPSTESLSPVSLSPKTEIPNSLPTAEVPNPNTPGVGDSAPPLRRTIPTGKTPAPINDNPFSQPTSSTITNPPEPKALDTSEVNAYGLPIEFDGYGYVRPSHYTAR